LNGRANVTAESRGLARIAVLLERAEVREYSRTTPFREKLARYTASAAEESADREFVREFERDPAAGATPDETGAVLGAQELVAARRRDRVPEALGDLAVRLGAVSDLSADMLVLAADQ
jgi:hypothetical protein